MEIAEVSWLFVVDQWWSCQQQLSLSGQTVVTAMKWLLGILSKGDNQPAHLLQQQGDRVIKFIRMQQASHCLFQCHDIVGIVQHG